MRLTFAQVEEEAQKRGLQLTKLHRRECQYEVVEVGVPGAHSEDHGLLVDAWQAIYWWDNAAAAKLRTAAEKAQEKKEKSSVRS